MNDTQETGKPLLSFTKSTEERPQTEYYYVRTNKSGEAVLRRDTDETVKYVSEVLEDNGIPFEYKSGGYCFVIYKEETGKYYQYFNTTGRWGVFRGGKRRPAKHYSSKGIQDFLDRFFNK